MSIQVYIVMGTTGQYSDRTQWTVGAYQDKTRADMHADLAMTEACRIAKERPSRYHSTDQVNIYDSKMSMSYTGADYYVLSVDLLEFLQHRYRII
jgi:hypothetical protein